MRELAPPSRRLLSLRAEWPADAFALRTPFQGLPVECLASTGYPTRSHTAA
jgi:hypothetical protein